MASRTEEKNASISQLFRFAEGIDKLLLTFGVMGSIGDGLMQPITMILLSRLINTFGSKNTIFTTETVNKYAIELISLALAVGTAAFLGGWCWTRTAERQVSCMRRKYIEAVLRQEVEYFETSSSTSATFQVVSSISTDADTVQDFLSDKVSNILSSLTAFVFLIVVAFKLSWRMASAVLPFSLFFIVPGVVYGKVLMKLGVEIRKEYGIAGGIAEQAISSIRTVVSYVGEQRSLEKYKKALEKSTELGIKQGFIKGLVTGSMGMIYAVWSFQSWVGSILIINMGESGGSVFISQICVILAGLSIMSSLPNVRYFSEAITASSRIFELIDRLSQLKNNDDMGVTIENIRGEIEFKSVKFSYPSRPDTLVISGLDLKVNAGQTIGLVGGSGSGKSTVISLLQRFYQPDEGVILLDGKDIRNLQLKWFRSQIGLVSQEPVLFATSIKENILFGNQEATMSEVVRAAKTANAHDFITNFPNGYDTHVGHFGVQMSGGQKQRVAIARALIRYPKILLLDEATSALDAQSERVVQEALDRASTGRTTVIVAHRLSTLRSANLIAVLQAGNVVECGSHRELTKLNEGEGGIYYKMMQLQKSEVQRGSPITERINSPVDSAISTIYYTPEQGFRGHEASARQEEILKKPSNNPSHRRLLKMNKPEWKRGLLGCLGAVAYGLVHPTYAYCMGTVLTVYFLQNNEEIKSKTRLYSLIFMLLALVAILANILQHYNFGVMGERLTKRVRETMLAKVLSFEIGWFDEDQNSSAAVSARLATEANLVRSLVGDRLSLLLQTFITASLAFTLGLVITWRLSIVIIAIQPFTISAFYLRKVLLTNMSKKAKKAQIEGSQLAGEAVVNHRTITAFSSQNTMLRLFEKTQEGPKKENIKQAWFSGVCLFICQFIVTCSTALAFWYGGILIIHNQINSTHMFQAFFILTSTGKLIADAGSMTTDLAKGGNAVNSVLEILDRQSKINPDDPKGIKRKKGLKGHVKFKNVNFYYPSRPEQMIFSNFSFKIEARKTVALVGKSGSGKSTVISLIERFYDPVKGSVEIDGINIKDYNLRFLRTQISLVSQEPTLFAGTIRENIAYGRDDASEAELVRAAELANAHEFISGMEEGYGAYCGERGVQLSGGQKQRIALARAILKNPAVLLLDEATSALDSISENLVQRTLDKMMVGRTCIVVAHRLSTIQKSDSIAVIKNGQVIEEGSHSELTRKGRGGTYYELIKLQCQSP
ncbi:putative multidrug resistance protein isoform X2 [Dioscorea cayenensis subsp. rotundata]|uniref:Multidrug resistance protein isoform X2 n=1 Tax=Dioscorea cayennensis subsp. rotundata TaxID=55577 RepID=A0AB40BC89_DIOCR|nr:putative multidrug resistance protein isoform X2 [Dioscorea cayenensis subsp. rotundata]